MKCSLSPEECDHEGYIYSCSLALSCGRCGAKLFLPPRHLAYRDADTLETMYSIWETAGWPEYGQGQWRMRWPIQEHPLFAHVGGIPVNPEKLADWEHMWQPFGATPNRVGFVDL